jgi:hypothetical protein
MQIVLVHSPLLTPSSWGDVPGHISRRGYAVGVPDLRPALDAGPPYYERMFDTIAGCALAEEPVAVVGHSAAGPLLPGALDAIGSSATAAVFLDARLPHGGRTWLEVLSPQRRAARLDLIVDGRLKPWDQWFPDENLSALFPEPLPSLPEALLHEVMPTSTWDGPAAYLQLSEAYADIADEAEANGWTVARYALDHLAPLTRPAEVAQAIARAL